MKRLLTALPVLIAAWVLALPAAAATGATASGSAKSQQQLIKKGEYLARAGDCIACHTAPGGKRFAGGYALPTPFGTLYTPNITPDNEYGIGQWSFDDFYNALHDGVAPGGVLGGHYLYPAFPYPSYTHIKRSDAKAIWAYLRSLKPVHYQPPQNEMEFPFNIRQALIGWRLLFFHPGTYKPNPKHSKEWNRGAYLVQGLGHCGACHTDHNFLGAKKEGDYLAGGAIPVQNWYAPNLTSNQRYGVGGWSKQEIVQLLKTGISAKNATFGPMSDVVHDSLQYLNDKDLDAIATYLKSLPAKDEPEPPDHQELSKEQRQILYSMGQHLYARHCSECHQPGGEGVKSIYPPLKDNGAIIARNPVDPIRMILQGGFEAPTQGNPRPFSMPPFAQILNDKQVAALATYIRQSWGNDASPVPPSLVEKYRTINMK